MSAHPKPLPASWQHVQPPTEELGYAAALRADADAGDLRKGESTRLRLLGAVAARLSAGEREAELRVADVTETAGVAHGTFYRYFSDRDAVVEAVAAGFVDFLRKGLETARDGATGSLARARAATLAYVRLFRANAGLMRLLLAVDAASPARDRFHALNREWNGRVAAAIATLRGRSGMTPRAREQTLAEAYALGGMVDEFLAQLYLRRDPALAWLVDDEEAVADLLAQLWYRAVHGGTLRPDGEAS